MDHSESEIIYFLLTGTIALLILSVGFTFIYAHYVRNLSGKQKELLELEKKHKQDLLESILESIEIERTRIARDLHDQVGNIFSLLSLILPQQEEDAKIKEARTLIDMGLRNTREIVYQIMPPELEIFGLEYALEELCIRVNKSEGLTAEYAIECDLKQYNPRIQISIYRIIQELISNTIKHSDANKFTLNFHGMDTGTEVSYRDNGTLKNEHSLEKRKGYGLKNIESRVHLLNGSFDYNFSKGFESRILIKNSYAD
ncbi:sensor histidine kinase [Pedobacter sp. L105]|uniref:sensor histidine kinase n=1 Tax=Pedobacter sp. L105 TaxID=1641871 RepID=UPI00131D27F0|nr:histidine kinase [Pedobacter sp. L105]